MLEIKRKPNSPGGRGTAAATNRARTETSAGPLGDDYAAEYSAVHSVPAMQPSPVASRKRPPLVAPPRSDVKDQQTKLPIITGEAQCKGSLNLDGIATGQLGGNSGSLSVRQRARSFFSEPEFSGEVSFRDMVRVNGHISGTIYSKTGTLIVDIGARVDGNVDVAVAVIGGIVNGDIVAHQRVEIGPGARIYGNIWTRSIEIKNGAIFEGVCTMILEEQIAG